MDKLISLRSAIKQSINLSFKNELLGFLFKSELASLLLFAIASIPLIIGMFAAMPYLGSIEKNQTPEVLGGSAIFLMIMGLLTLVCFVVFLYVTITMSIHTVLLIASEKTETIKTLVKMSFKNSGRMALHLTAKGFILFVGFMLFIIPGVILSIKFMFSEYLLIEENLGPIEALKRSSSLTSGYKWKLYIFTLKMSLLQFALLPTVIIVFGIIGNKSVGPVLAQIYATILQMVLLLVYKDLVRLKAPAAQPQIQ